MTIDVLRRKQLALLDPEYWDDRNDRYYMNLYKNYKKAEALYGFCASTVSETYHHWRVFTQSENGACIVFKKDRLEAHLGTLPGVRVSKIFYKTVLEMETAEVVTLAMLPFLKRKGFEAEAEYRIIAEGNDRKEQIYKIDIDLSFIQRITINPWLPKSISESIIETMKNINPHITFRIGTSTLIDNSRWKKAGDKVVNRRKPAALTTKSKKSG
jgi:hypothetical protein